LWRIIRLAAECGFGGVELSVHQEVWWGGAARIRRLAREHGLEIFSVHQTLLPARMAPGGAKMLDAVRTALAVGAPRVVIHGPKASSWSQPAARPGCAELGPVGGRGRERHLPGAANPVSDHAAARPPLFPLVIRWNSYAGTICASPWIPATPAPPG
jgi:sugar phosphate isomerase/epimerase